MEFLNPKMLLALSVIVPIIVFAWRWRSAPRWLPTAILRSLVASGIIVALAQPVLKLTSRKLTHVVAVDVSASVSDADIARANRLVTALREKLPKTSELHLVAFDSDARRIPLSQGGSTTLQLRDRSSNDVSCQTSIAKGLQAAAGLIDASTDGRITLISDGVDTDGQLLFAGRQLAASGITVDTVPLRDSSRDLMVANLGVPAFFTVGEKIQIRAALNSRYTVRGRALLMINGKTAGEKSMNLRSGKNEVAFEWNPKQPISVNCEVRFVPDRTNETPVFSRTVRLAPLSKLRVLLLESQPSRGRALQVALSREGIDLVIRHPAGGVGDLQNFNVVLIGDVTAKELGVFKQVALHDYVERDGGGLIMLGGERTYGPGGYEKTLVARALPVDLEHRRQEQDPTVALAIIIDTSGSMQGMRMQLAKEVAIRAARHLTPQDRVGVVEFYGSRRWAVPMQRASDIASVELIIERFRAAGGTVLYGALEEAYYALANVRARFKHALIISDGDVFPAPFNQLVSRMANEGMTVTTVKVAPEGSASVMQEVAFHGRGRAYDYAGITVPDINVKQQSKVPQSPFREQPFRPVVLKPRIEMLRGIQLQASPPLLGYVSVKPHPEAEVVLRTPQGEPLLARWQYGVGKSIAFTSDARDRWADRWLRWEGFSKFWSQVIRDVARDQSLPLTIGQIDAGARQRWRIELPSSMQSFRARGLDERGPVPINARRIGSTTYEVEFPPSRTRTQALTLSARDQEGITRHCLLTVPSLEESEFRSLEPDNATLAEVSRQTGGIFAPRLEDLLRPARVKRVPLDVWHWALAFSVITLLAEVLVRRLP